MYVFLHNASVGPGGGGGGRGGTCPLPPRRGREYPKKIFFAHYMYGNGLVEFGVVWGGLGCFNGLHDGCPNISNSQTSLPRAIGSPTDSRAVLPRAEG